MDVEPRRIVIALGLVFVLGVLFAVTNGWYATQEGGPLPLIVYAVALVSILIGASLVLLFQWRITRRQVERLLKVLPREERLVVRTLYERRGELEQNKIVALTGLSKVQVSRTVARLVERGVAEKKGLGNTNLVMLTL